jgi:hypothetical protein
MKLPDLTQQRGDPKAWAKRLIARHEAGERIRPISLRFAREALAEKNLLKERK